MENIINQLVPLAKGYFVVYVIGSIIAFVLTISIILFAFVKTIKEQKEFDKHGRFKS